jgi:heat shock protein HslJ
MRIRKSFTLVLGLVAVVGIVAACSGGGAASSSASAASSGGGGLTGKTWHLTAITEKVPAFQGVVPAADQANYTIEFNADLSFNAKADCNQLGGTYSTTGTDGLTIKPGPMTLVACPEGSLSSQYVESLGKAASYAIANGQLTITLTDEGTLVFN